MIRDPRNRCKKRFRNSSIDLHKECVSRSVCCRSNSERSGINRRAIKRRPGPISGHTPASRAFRKFWSCGPIGSGLSCCGAVARAPGSGQQRANVRKHRLSNQPDGALSGHASHHMTGAVHAPPVVPAEAETQKFQSLVLEPPLSEATIGEDCQFDTASFVG